MAILRAYINLLIIGVIWTSHLLVPIVVCIFVMLVNLIKGNFFNLKDYLVDVLYSQDQLVNTVLCGTPDTTVSGRTGYWSAKGDPVAQHMEKFINLLFFFQPDHCAKAIEPDEDHGKPFII